MTTMRERIARKLIDIDPCISGYHPLHLELKYPIIDAVLDEPANPSDAMVRVGIDATDFAYGPVSRRWFKAAFAAAIMGAKEGK